MNDLIDAIQTMTKMQQHRLMQALDGMCPLSKVEIARRSNRSATMVYHVFNGLNANGDVLRVILESLPQGWQERLPEDMQKLLLTPQNAG